MPDGGIVTTFTDITPSVKAAEELERANETLERRVRERTERADPAQQPSSAAPRPTPSEANISKTRFLAAASHDILQPLNAARLYVTSLVERQRGGDDAQLDRQYRRLARRGRGDLRRAARHLAARHRRDEAGDRQLPHRRTAAPARSRIRAAGARERARSSTSCPARWRCGPTAGCCAGCCRTWSPTRSNTRRKGRVLVGCRRRSGTAAHRRLRHRARHSALQDSRRSSRSFTGSTRAPRWRAGSASGSRSSSASRACSITRSTVDSTVGRGSHFSVEVPLRAGRAAARAAGARRATSIAASSPASTVLCIDNEPRSSTAWRRCSAAGAAGCSRRRTSPTAIAAIDETQGRARRPAGRLPSRRRQRHRSDRRAAPAIRRRPAGHPDHRRPQPATCARRRARTASRCSTSRSSRRRCAR